VCFIAVRLPCLYVVVQPAILSCTYAASILFSFLLLCGSPSHLHSFPTRRSSDLHLLPTNSAWLDQHNLRNPYDFSEILAKYKNIDRKSTRLNSSHVSISYAVFCLKKKINI